MAKGNKSDRNPAEASFRRFICLAHTGTALLTASSPPAGQADKKTYPRKEQWWWYLDIIAQLPGYLIKQPKMAKGNKSHPSSPGKEHTP